jgi:hypothetical protein
MATHPRPGRMRPEPRLDPVRWRRPGRGSLLRLIAVAALLAVAAAAVLFRPQTCAPSPPVAGALTGRAASARPGGGADPAARTGDGGAGLIPGAGAEPIPGAGAGPIPGAGGAPRNGAPAVPPGTVGVPVRLAEPTALTLVRPGDKVDLLRVNDTGQDSTIVADAALVLSVTGADDPTTGGLLLALRPAEAAKAVAAQGRGFAILIRPG